MTTLRVLVLSLLMMAIFVCSIGMSKRAILAQGRTALTAIETESLYDRAGQLKTSTSRVIGSEVMVLRSVLLWFPNLGTGARLSSGISSIFQRVRKLFKG